MSGRAVRDPSKRDALAASIRILVFNAEMALDSIDPELLGEIEPAVSQSLSEIGFFVDGWTKISADSDDTVASPYMWASFLQTFERYRAILNYYDKLEGRGDATTTSQMAVRREKLFDHHIR